MKEFKFVESKHFDYFNVNKIFKDNSITTIKIGNFADGKVLYMIFRGFRTDYQYYPKDNLDIYVYCTIEDKFKFIVYNDKYAKSSNKFGVIHLVGGEGYDYKEATIDVLDEYAIYYLQVKNGKEIDIITNFKVIRELWPNTISGEEELKIFLTDKKEN